MTYTKQTWNDGASGGTPVDAARLNWMETGIQDASNRLGTNEGNISSLQTWQTNQTRHPVYTGGSAPTAAMQAGAGTTPPAAVVNANSRDARGSLTFGTGTTPAAGNMVTVTFNQTWTAAPFVVIAPMNAATATLNDYVTSVTTTGFTIAVATAPAASQGNTIYAIAWHAFG